MCLIFLEDHGQIVFGLCGHCMSCKMKVTCSSKVMANVIITAIIFFLNNRLKVKVTESYILGNLKNFSTREMNTTAHVKYISFSLVYYKWPTLKSVFSQKPGHLCLSLQGRQLLQMLWLPAMGLSPREWLER